MFYIPDTANSILSLNKENQTFVTVPVSSVASSLSSMGLSNLLSSTSAERTMISFLALPSCNTSNTTLAGDT